MGMAEIMAKRNAEGQQNLQTGMQGSTSVGAQAIMSAVADTPLPAPATDLSDIDPLIGKMPGDGVLVAPTDTPPVVELPAGPPGSYRALSLARYVKRNGKWVYPNAEGFFIPQDDEDLENLEHFATQWNMVEYQGSGQQKLEV